jgi:lipid-A-disaccharide synthase
MAVMGVSEVLRRFRFFRGVFHEMLGLLATRRPAAVILVDYPGFNLRFAARARAMGIKVIYYVCPQVWAWHRERIPRMARIIDRLITIFPFEKALFDGTGLRVDFAGHPMVEETQRVRSEPLAALPWDGSPRVALLPGSRAHEIRRLLPAMWSAAAFVERKHPDASFLLAAPSEAIAAALQAHLPRLGPGPGRAQIVAGQTRQVLRQAHAAWVASGTATVEAALMRCPTVVTYKVAWPTYFMGKALVRIPHIGMVNVLAQREVCPELIQRAATPRTLADAIEPLLTDTAPRRAMVEALDRVAESLGAPGAAERAAEAVMEEIGG